MDITSISCSQDTRARLNELRDEEYENWDAFLNALADCWEEVHGEPSDE